MSLINESVKYLVGLFFFKCIKSYSELMGAKKEVDTYNFLLQYFKNVYKLKKYID